MEIVVATEPISFEKIEAARTALTGTQFAAVPVEQLADIYERFLRLTSLGQANVAEWVEMPKEISALKHAIFAQSDFGAVFAGQWLPKDVRKEVRDRVAAELRSQRTTK